MEISLALFSAGVSRELSREETSDLAELSPILDTGISAKSGITFRKQENW